MQLGKTKPKYRNRKVEVKGIKFDSKLEGHVYLKILELAKEHYFNFKLQPSYELVEKFKINGKTVRAITYRADFELKINNKVFTIDTKGFETDVFKLKKKLFAYRYGREVICIKSVKQFDIWFREVIKQ